VKRTTTVCAENPRKKYLAPQEHGIRAYAEIAISGPMDSGTYQMTKDEIVIGRGGDRPVDVAIKHPSVSRIHLQIRRDAASGRFFVRNFGDYGSTLNGIPIPKSVPDPNRGSIAEMLLPPSATIDLAEGSAVLEFLARSGE
jgi:hypothetical protein